MLRAHRDLQEQKARRGPREKEVPLVSEEPLELLGQQVSEESMEGWMEFYCALPRAAKAYIPSSAYPLSQS